MKLVVVPNSNNNLDKYIKIGAQAFIFGLDRFSINYPVTLTIEEIKKIVDKAPNIEVFISINKTIFNHELEALEKELMRLNELPIKGVLFYDLAVLSLYRKHQFQYDLVWHQTHMVTNYNTCNYYYDKGVKYAVLASEITKDEMVEIKKHTSMQLFAFLIGHPIMAHSKRKLLTNYYDSIRKDYDQIDKVIEESDNTYIVKENQDGTCILNGNIINGMDYAIELAGAGIEYGIIHGASMPDSLLELLIPLVYDVLNHHSNASLEEIKKLIGNDTGFFNKKTIFKVKKNEK